MPKRALEPPAAQVVNNVNTTVKGNGNATFNNNFAAPVAAAPSVATAVPVATAAAEAAPAPKRRRASDDAAAPADAPTSRALVETERGIVTTVKKDKKLRSVDVAVVGADGALKGGCYCCTRCPHADLATEFAPAEG